MRWRRILSNDRERRSRRTTVERHSSLRLRADRAPRAVEDTASSFSLSRLLFLLWRRQAELLKLKVLQTTLLLVTCCLLPLLLVAALAVTVPHSSSANVEKERERIDDARNVSHCQACRHIFCSPSPHSYVCPVRATTTGTSGD